MEVLWGQSVYYWGTWSLRVPSRAEVHPARGVDWSHYRQAVGLRSYTGARRAVSTASPYGPHISILLWCRKYAPSLGVAAELNH